MLIPIRHLLNGASIVQEPVAEVRYFHVELAGDDGAAVHDVLLAQGLPCESYLDTGNRGAFANGGAAVALHPDFARSVWAASSCAPLVESGPRLADLRTWLLAEATACGHGLTADSDLRVLADGRPISPRRANGGTCRFALPSGTSRVRLFSRLTVPAWLDTDSSDWRRVGVAVVGLELDGRPVPLDDPRLLDGWHAPEPDLRWTAGPAALDPAGARALAVTLAPLQRYWTTDPARPAARPLRAARHG
jgi:hypothetical protein